MINIKIWPLFVLKRSIFSIVIGLFLATTVAFLPEFSGLSDAGRWTFFILLFAAILWITDAIPAFAVGLVVIALEIAILGKPGGVFADDPDDWQLFVRPWASPIIWLFLGGFVMAKAAVKTQLDSWFSSKILYMLGGRPSILLFGVMAITFCFSMFMSNTATTAMMLTVIVPIIKSIKSEIPFRKGLILSIPFAANIGGMATIIGTPPNAIAAGSLDIANRIDFFQWMLLGLPPALFLFVILWFYLKIRYPSEDKMELSGKSFHAFTDDSPSWMRMTVMVVFFITICLWLTESLHKIPATVISFLPITLFSVFGILNAAEIRQLEWDVLILIAGGLALGVGVTETGLGEWIIQQIPSALPSDLVLAILLAYFICIISNFMSNTAAASVFIPTVLGLAPGAEYQLIVPIALSSSAAMCLPVSTPPNAIAYSQGGLNNRDFLVGGLIAGLLAPIVSVTWCHFILV